MTRPYYIAAGVAIAGLLLIGLNWPHVSNTITTSFNQPTPITVGLKWKHQGEFAGYYVAEQKGWYKQNRLNVTLKAKEAGEDTAAKVASGEFQFGIVSGRDALQTYAATQNIIAVAALAQDSPAILVTLAKSKINTIANLRGKRLGVGPNDTTGARSLYPILLQRAKVPINSVSFIDVGQEQVQALIHGDVDAVIVYRTQELYQFETKGVAVKTIKPEEYGVDNYNDVLIANKQWLDKNPEAAAHFINSSLAGWRYAASNPEEATDITLPYTSGVYQDRDFQKHIITTNIPLLTPKDANPIGYMTASRWQNTYKQMREVILLPNYDINEMFTNRYVLAQGQ
jgi:ABC-type nitrate/sulfonate/bicarbonate transport system substrate-binding protein